MNNATNSGKQEIHVKNIFVLLTNRLHSGMKGKGGGGRHAHIITCLPGNLRHRYLHNSRVQYVCTHFMPFHISIINILKHFL